MFRFLPLLVAVVVFTTILTFRAQILTEIKKIELSGTKVSSELLSDDYLKKILSSTGKFDPGVNRAVWFNQEVTVPENDLAAILAGPAKLILGESTGDKWIEVNLDNQHLYAHQGNRIVFDFPISSGLPWLPTVTGEFHIWAKVRSQRMTGGTVASGTFYDLPNVPFVQFFYRGYSLHGAYWHNDFGKPRSHGCVNISIPNAVKLFEWTDPQLGPDEYARYKIDPAIGTRVVVHGATPTNIW